MIAGQLITDTIPPLKMSDKGAKAFDWMYEFKTTHMPLVDGKHFVGLVCEDDILDFNNPEQSLDKLSKQLYRPVVKEHEHIYEVIRHATQIHSTLIPVVDNEENYIGVITTESLLEFFAQLSGIQEDGGIIVVRLNGLKDYLLSDIARLVEANEAYILSLYMHHENNEAVKVTLKLSTPDIQRIVATFERFEYEVETYYQEADMRNLLKDRYDSLMNFLKI